MDCCVGLIPLKFNQKFSLKSLSVDCSIRNLLVSCTSTIVYKNDENEDIEALFSFPLDNNCVVYYLEAIIGNKTLIGICKEVEEAKNLYKTAKEKGHMVAMIERNISMTDVFKCRIGNFPKNSEAKIIFKFAMELKLSLARHEMEGVDRLNLALPLILRPRYTPPDYEGDREIFAVTNKYEYHFKANISGTKVINDISSVNHKLGVEYTNENKTNAQIVLQSEYDGTKDLDINIDYIAMREPSVFYEFGTDSAHYKGKQMEGAFYKSDVAMVNFLPKFPVEKSANYQKLEIVFVVDRSGSMQGSNIERAKECLLVFLKSLPMNCKFQIYGFGSTFDKAFNDSQLYSDQSITTALNYQKLMGANLGGTELMQPLQDMYNSPLASDYSRVAFVLTDGDVGNQDEVTRLVRKHNKTTRLFTVGIGDGVSTSLVDKVAKSGLGKSVFVRNTKELSASVIELLDIAINCNPFNDAKIEWKCPDHISIVSVPTSTPPIFSDYFLTIFCMIQGMRPDDKINCTLSGNVNGKPVNFSLTINYADGVVDEEFQIHRLLAKYKIDEMTSQIEDGVEDIKQSLIQLSTEVNIVTNWTTFVAIDQDAPDKVLITCDDELIYPVSNFGNIGFAPGGCLVYASNPLPPPPMAAKYLSTNRNKMPCKKIVERRCFNMAAPVNLCSNVANLEYIGGSDHHVQKNIEVDIIMFLVDKQNINGSWNYDKDIFVKIGLTETEIESKKPNNINDELWITIIIYQFLTVKEQSREKEWRLFAKKAHQWIENNLKDPDTMASFLKISLELFQ